MSLQLGTQPCHCRRLQHDTKLVAITGGPGAGKSAVLELGARLFCRHVVVLPEAASLVFGGGFPRTSSDTGRRAAQRAIFHVQHEIERLALSEDNFAVALCDRGTIDGLAYWPGPQASYWEDLGTTLEEQLARYDAVIHLETPDEDQGYNHKNELRTETPKEAKRIDDRILDVWAQHPNRVCVPSQDDFFDKVMHALKIVRTHVPDCCQA